MTEERDLEYYQGKIDLTPEQKKAWTQLVKAINKCRKEKIYFYQNLEHLHGLNGKNVRTVVGSNDFRVTPADESRCFHNGLSAPYVKTVCSFADDDHYVFLHEDEVTPKKVMP